MKMRRTLQKHTGRARYKRGARTQIRKKNIENVIRMCAPGPVTSSLLTFHTCLLFYVAIALWWKRLELLTSNSMHEEGRALRMDLEK